MSSKAYHSATTKTSHRKKLNGSHYDLGLNRSEYIRQSALHCKVVERLSPRDVKAIRDLQGIAENLNRTAKFVGAILKGGASEEQIVRTYREIIECKDFVLSLIKIYRNTPDSV